MRIYTIESQNLRQILQPRQPRLRILNFLNPRPIIHPLQPATLTVESAAASPPGSQRGNDAMAAADCWRSPI